MENLVGTILTDAREAAAVDANHAVRHDGGRDMPLLSRPFAPRFPVHTREVTCCGYQRADGLWDIEARMNDRKGYALQNDHRAVAAGASFHDMALRVTVNDTLEIRAIGAWIDAEPHRICPSVTPNFQCLVGVQIENGFGSELRRRFGGVHGCIHLIDLFGPLATTAIQTVHPLRPRSAEAEGARWPARIDTCHALAADGGVVAKYWPQHRRS